MSDEIKDNTKETFDYFESQGVEVKIISGDNHVCIWGGLWAGFKEEARAIDMTKVSDEDLKEWS